jgi:multimeric flavodoxin WrbA
MRILGIFGSPRAGGNSDILLQRFLEGAEVMKLPFQKFVLPFLLI